MAPKRRRVAGGEEVEVDDTSRRRGGDEDDGDGGENGGNGAPPAAAPAAAAAAAAGAVPYQRHSQSSRVTLTWTPSSQQHMAHSLQQEVGRVVFNSWLKVATALIAGTRYWNNTWSFEQLVTSQN